VAAEPTRLYQAKIAVRAWLGMTWDSAACSIARNGPTSLPLGLMTPIVAARMSRIRWCAKAKTIPAKSMRIAPRTSIFLRPIRSALVVRASETIVSPRSVRVRINPHCRSVRPSCRRYSMSTTARKP
jgi:hypothetical protein